ncbi:MAG: hypothetical protein Udaeo2_06540 [Candidatus Udaeobacter sp.]|nr:MAG: hypothetical protein Udaeo2_06540 [Candidatus Udaeobacter sp.]
MAMDSAGGCCASFHHCAGAGPDRVEPNHQATFGATLAELKKDREWLKNLDATNQSTN